MLREYEQCEKSSTSGILTAEGNTAPASDTVHRFLHLARDMHSLMGCKGH